MPGFGGWFGKKEWAGGGPLIDLGVHRLDLALWFMGYPAVEYVAGATYDPIAKEIARKEDKHFSVEDLAVGFVRFKDGASLSLEASWAANIKENELMETRVLGTCGGLVHRNLNEGYSYEGEFFTEQDGNLWDQKLHEASGFAVSNVAAGTKKSAMSHFIDAIQNNRPHDADAEQGLGVMKILDALYRSAESGKPVTVA
jgi:predicted dehydrogenase